MWTRWSGTSTAGWLGLGKLRAAPMAAQIPLALMRPMVLYLPIPKGKAKTLPELLATGTYNFNAERARFHTLIEEFALKPLHFNWLRPSDVRSPGAGQRSKDLRRSTSIITFDSSACSPPGPDDTSTRAFRHRRTSIS